MTDAESTTVQPARLARRLLEDARREIGAGDTVQGSEKLWGATSRALKAYCASRELPHGKCADRRHAVLELAESRDNPFVRATFGVAESCHSNFCNDWMEHEHLDGYLPDIDTLVNIILDSAAS